MREEDWHEVSEALGCAAPRPGPGALKELGQVELLNPKALKPKPSKP